MGWVGSQPGFQRNDLFKHLLVLYSGFLHLLCQFSIIRFGLPELAGVLVYIGGSQSGFEHSLLALQPCQLFFQLFEQLLLFFKFFTHPGLNGRLDGLHWLLWFNFLFSGGPGLHIFFVRSSFHSYLPFHPFLVRALEFLDLVVHNFPDLVGGF